MQIGLPEAFRLIMGMAYVIADYWFLATNFTHPCHILTS